MIAPYSPVPLSEGRAFPVTLLSCSPVEHPFFRSCGARIATDADLAGRDQSCCTPSQQWKWEEFTQFPENKKRTTSRAITTVLRARHLLLHPRCVRGVCAQTRKVRRKLSARCLCGFELSVRSCVELRMRCVSCCVCVSVLRPLCPRAVPGSASRVKSLPSEIPANTCAPRVEFAVLAADVDLCCVPRAPPLRRPEWCPALLRTLLAFLLAARHRHLRPVGAHENDQEPQRT